MFIDLKGKTAFITGGASGMGLGIAKACAREGMNVAIADFRQSAIDEAVPWFEKHGFPVMGVNLDVTDREAMSRRPTLWKPNSVISMSW